jgi:hypothetical protein
MLLAAAVRVPLVSWAERPSAAGNLTTTNLTESCGCWALNDARWVDLDVGNLTPIIGVEATVGHPFRANLSTDGVRWDTSFACAASPCLFGRVVSARWVRLSIFWFDAFQDAPVFSGAVLGCRYSVQAVGLQGGGFGDTGVAVFVREARGASRPPPLTPPVLEATGRLLPPNRTVTMPVAVYDQPLARANSSNVSLAARWVGDLLELYGVGPWLEAGLLRRAVLAGRNRTTTTTDSAQQQDLLWLAVIRAPRRIDGVLASLTPDIRLNVVPP